MRHPFALLLSLLLLTACGGEPTNPSTGGTPSAASPESPQADSSEADASASAAASGDHPHGKHTHDDAGVPAEAGVVLLRDGLGVVAFGEDAEPALERLEAAMGRANVVTRWLSGGQSMWGVCPGNALRGAKWGDLWVLFSDSTDIRERGHHPFSWMLTAQAGHTGRTGLRTAEGIGHGSTVAELKAAYGDRLVLADSPEGGGPHFRVDVEPGEDGWPKALDGTVTGVADDDTVTSLRGGQVCGE